MMRFGPWLALCVLAVSEAWASPPLDAYGKLPSIEGAQISPDGAHFAMILTDGDLRSVAIFKTSDRKAVKVIRAATAKIRQLQWAGPDDLIVTVSKDMEVVGLENDKREWFLASDYNIKTGKTQALLDRIDSRMDNGGRDLNTLNSEPMVRSINNKPHVFVESFHFSSGRGENSLYDFDPGTGIANLIGIGVDHTNAWLVDAKRRPLAQTLYDAKAKRWTLKVREGETLRPVKAFEQDIEHPAMIGLGRDGASVLLVVDTDTKDGSSRQDLVEFTPGAKDWGAPINDRATDEAIFDAQSNALIAVRTLVGDDSRYRFFNSADQKIWDGTVKAYPDSRVDLVSMSADHRKLIVTVDSPTEGEAYAIVDIDAHKGEWLGFNYDDAAKSMALKSPIAFKAADGLALTGYLTLPAGREARRLPLIVFPHGGPAARDEPGYDWWAQAMASRGYAVLQVNYRGSSGFGWDFMKAGFGEFGRKMQTDLSDGVRYLAAKGAIDPERVCIVGASYGGYAALAGATIDTGVYRCAVSMAGISDLKRVIDWSADDEHGGALSKRYWLRFMGVESPGVAKLDEISPIKRVDKVTIPVLLIHGKDDTVVNIAQSQVMYDALKRQGKDVELVVLPHENHHLLTGATRLQMLQATMAFLAKYNPAE